ncbi:hypothetical protein QCA50_005623 [Cerrena zonata]|uniref:BTB domain-containing protein n=1 Tax=Cerrena zonata TaxID=2478898 RepID=A0AAW0GAY5_9APHY
MAEPVSKKRKTDENTDPKTNQKRAVDAGLWFEDGNIILVAQHTPFKVHRGLLSHKSEVFKDIFTLPPPEKLSGDDIMDGIPTIQMSDNWQDLSDVLSALYNGQGSFGFRKKLHFRTVSALLRLGNKYGLVDLEQEAIARLQRLFPSDLQDFQNGYTESDYERENMHLFCSTSRIRLRSSDAIAAVNLARAYNIPSILPAAFYICSRLPVELLVQGVSTPKGTSPNILSRVDLIRCWNGQIELGRRYGLKMQAMSNAIAQRPACTGSWHCQELKKTWEAEDDRDTDCQDALGCCLVGSQWVTTDDEELCAACHSRRVLLWDDFRQSTWDDLPKIFDVENNM